MTRLLENDSMSPYGHVDSPQCAVVLVVDGRRIELPLGRTTLGTSPRCSVRLYGDGIQPLHCLVTRGETEIHVRRWAGDARINGEPFESTSAMAGDQLTLGALQLEFVDPNFERLQSEEPLWQSELREIEADSKLDDSSNTVDSSEVDAAEDPNALQVTDEPTVAPVPAHLEELRVNLDLLRDQVQQLEEQFGQVDADRLALLRGELQQHEEQWRAQQEAANLKFGTCEAQIADCVRRLDELMTMFATLRDDIAEARRAEPASSERHHFGAEATPEAWGGHHEGPEATDDVLDECETVHPPSAELEAELADHSNSPATSDKFETPVAEPEKESASLLDSLRRSPSEYDWSTLNDSIETAAAEAPNVDTEDEPRSGAPAAECETENPFASSWQSSASADDIEATDCQPDQLDERWGRSAGTDTEAAALTDGQAPIEQMESEEPDEPFGAYSVWNRNDSTNDDATEAPPVSADTSSPKNDPFAASVHAPGTQSPAPEESHSSSFIERYAHLFADDEPACETAPAGASMASQVEPLASLRDPEHTLPADSSSNASEVDEESIEQYMAKLLERVRGDGAQTPETPGKPAPPAAPKVEKPTQRPVVQNATDDSRWLPNFGSAERQASKPAPVTDLNALRAIANESARHAISRHSVLKLRRDALTKVIIAVLAGLISAWLMGQYKQYSDLQFTGACIALVVAVYWAGQACRKFVETARLQNFDRADDDVDESDSLLPIDV